MGGGLIMVDYYRDIVEDLYDQAAIWDTLWEIDFYLSDAERVDDLMYFYGYSYWEAIREVICEIEYEVYGIYSGVY